MSVLLRGFTAQLRALAARRTNWLMVALCMGAAAISVATYRQGAMREMPAAVYDQDGTGLSRTLVRSLDATPELRVVTDAPATLEAAQAALVRGDLSAVVVIPDGFTADVKRGRRAELVVAVDMANILVGKTAQRAVQRTVVTLGAGVQMSVIEKLGVPASSALARVVPITATEALPGNPGASYAPYAAPAFGLSFAHIIALFLAWTVLWPPAPGRTARETMGRLLACLAVGMVLALVLAYGILPLAGVVPASNPGVVLLALAALVVADLLFAVAMCTIFRGGLIGFQLTVMLAMLSLMLSGLTWPWEAIPAPLRALSSAIPFTPFGRAMRIFVPAAVSPAALARPMAWTGLQCLGYLAVIALGAGAGRLLALLGKRQEVRP
jgi:ABC-2 type transport system permease protein